MKDCKATIETLIAAAGEPGHHSPGQIAEGLAAILRAKWSRPARLVVAGGAMLSLDYADREMLADAALDAPTWGDAIEARRKSWLARWKAEREGGA
ncbi:hypothetical protein H0I76_09910 [Limibaculum sp. M0105]|uniref:Uncharacterized protein n=1 Tax=Thermohalobaculum xanthum TaxID=2753746 RepID=A0A8J7M6K1_9RHOB|nr:hypothetical protein [Thermohalobaculum xanthum]MBK0399506.1 hypothetical protein [Thermohalobaculum xanthum]